MNRAFSAGGFALTTTWGAAPGWGEYCAFGVKHIRGLRYICPRIKRASRHVPHIDIFG